MSFFNSLLIRITLAVIGGILYAFLIYLIVLFLALPSSVAILAAFFIFLFYSGSRFLILFSGINSLYYSRRGKPPLRSPDEKNSFYQTTQWVGRFYHYHDIVLFLFLIVLSIVFLISLLMDWAGSHPFGNTMQHFWERFFPVS